MSQDFEVEIRVWSDNLGKATSDCKTRINGESLWQVEPTLTFATLAEVYSNLKGFFSMMEMVEKTVIEPMFGTKNKGELN